MSETFGFFISDNGDRIYSDARLAAPFGAIVGNAGVVAGIYNELKPSVNGMEMSIASGFAFGGILPGWWYKSTEVITKTISSAATGKKRIDRVVLRFDRNVEVREVSCEVLVGEEAEDNPVAPQITINDTVFEICIAEITIAGSTISNFVDKREYVDICRTGNNKIWHEGNDGSESGLDADLLDGKESDDFVQVRGNQNVDGVKIFSSAPQTSEAPTSDNDLVNKAFAEANYRNVDSGWLIPSLENSWINYGTPYNSAAYRKIGNQVFLRGMVKWGQVDSTIFTLPVDFRPTSGKHLLNSASDSDDVVDYSTRLEIYIDGTIISKGNDNSWVSLDGLSFFVD